MSHRGNRLRKQVKQAKEGALVEVRREKGKGDVPGGKRRETGKVQTCSQEVEQ